MSKKCENSEIFHLQALNVSNILLKKELFKNYF